jgi:hypothetical protein
MGGIIMNLLCITFETQNINLAPIIAAAIAAIIVVIGWFIIAWLNRRNEIAKELRSYRLDMLKTTIQYRQYFFKMLQIATTNNSAPNLTDPQLLKLAEDSFLKIQMYGMKDETNIMEAISKEHDNQEFINKVQELTTLCLKRLHKELNFKQ